MRIELSARISPSESEIKVRSSIANLVPLIGLTTELDPAPTLRGGSNESETLRTIYEGLRARLSLGVARRLLIQNRSGTVTWLDFNRQAAYLGVPAICDDPDDSPLGSIKVTISADEMDVLIDWLAPPPETGSSRGTPQFRGRQLRKGRERAERNP